MKDETSGVVIGEFIGLKTNVYSFLINENSENKKAKSVNKNNVEKKTHDEYKDVFFRRKCLKYSMN